jgi:hypothetical protein
MVNIPRGRPDKEHKDLGEAMNGPAFPRDKQQEQAPKEPEVPKK